MKILVRGDCTSRRMLMLNRDKFRAPISLVTNEKAPNAVFADHIKGIVADPAFLEDFIDETKMGKSQLLYFKRQFERNVLDEKGASLIVFDPYSEMNFQLWKHKKDGWRFWVPTAAIKDQDAFAGIFDTDGYADFESSVEDTTLVMKHMMANNPGAPVVFLPQLLDYYPALAEREFFNDLGKRLAQNVPELFVGQRVAHKDQEPDDLGTGGGPEYTLHFKAKTYWQEMAPAVEKGLLDKVAEIHKVLLKTDHALPKFEADRYPLSLCPSTNECLPTCDNIVTSVRNNLQQYFLVNDPDFERTKEVKFRSALIDLAKYRDYVEYESVVKKSGKGARIRSRNKATKKGYYCHPFHWRMHIPDIHDINHSTDRRSGGQMRGSYLRSVEEMGGAPTRDYKPAIPKCNYHWVYPWGVFEKIEGYKQGEFVTNERLVGYIFLRRFGDFTLYSQILGHYDHLKDGIMILLHHEVVKWILDSHEEATKNLKAIMYAGYDQGTEGLIEWKRRESFEPFLVEITDNGTK